MERDGQRDDWGVVAVSDQQDGRPDGQLRRSDDGIEIPNLKAWTHIAQKEKPMKAHVSTVAAILLLALSSSIGCVVPVGSIVPYGGTIAIAKDVPDGWLLCDGRPVPEGSAYDDLRELLRETAWGSEGAVIHLPDLRGMFLRGVDDPDGPAGKEWEAAGNDEDPDKRQDRITRQPSTLVGSVQDYATARPGENFWANLRHHHEHGRAVAGHVMAGGTEPPRNNDGRADTDFRLSETEVTTKGGGDKETRPRNAYVNFIIKY